MTFKLNFRRNRCHLVTAKANRTARIRAGGLLICASLVLSRGARADEVVVYIHTDALGSPIAATDALGNVVERTVYEPYGEIVNRPPDDRPGYSSHVIDSATGLTYMQQRYFDAEIGLFLSSDPVAANVQLFGRYHYANANPYRFTDPDGRAPYEKLQVIPKLKEAAIGSRIKGGGVAPGSRAGTLGGGTRGGGSAPAQRSGATNTPRGFFSELMNISSETEVAAAYGAGLRYTRDWKDRKDSLGIVAVGVGVRASMPGRVTATGLPSLEVAKMGYNWGAVNAPVDIVGSFSAGFASGSVNFDPGTGLNASISVNPAVGSYTGVSVMFDDTLVPDR